MNNHCELTATTTPVAAEKKQAPIDVRARRFAVKIMKDSSPATKADANDVFTAWVSGDATLATLLVDWAPSHTQEEAYEICLEQVKKRKSG